MNVLFEAASEAATEPCVTIYPEEISGDGYSSQSTLFAPEHITRNAHEAMVEILTDCRLAPPAGEVIARVSKNEPMLLRSPRAIGRHLAIEYARQAGRTEGVIFRDPVWHSNPIHRVQIGTVVRGRTGYEIHVDGTDGPWRALEIPMRRLGTCKSEELGSSRRLPDAMTIARDHIEHHRPHDRQEAHRVAA